MKIIEKNLKDLVPYEQNTKKHDKVQIDNVATSIEKYGFVQPIVIDKNNVVIIGHCRLLAAKQLKLNKIPCVCAEDLTEEEVKALRIVDNKTNESDWDFDFLAEELPEIDLSDFDFDFDLPEEEEEELLDYETTEDEVPEVDEEKEPITKLGDIWQLGRHRLLCGDSTSKADIEKLMDGKKADLVFTDPPYGMKKEADGVANDNLNYDDLLVFNKKWIPLTFEMLKDNGSWYCWGIDEPLMDIYSNILKPMAKENKIIFRNLLTWDKGHGQGQLAEEFRMYPIADEKCLFVMCGVQGFNTNSDNYYEGWESIRSYLFNEWRKVSSKNDWDKYLGNCMGKHYFTKSQWLMPTEEQYLKMQEIGKKHNAFKKEYEEIKKEYEEIKKEFYKSRSYFDNTHDNMNNVWHFDRTTGEERESAGGHATPKPIALCARAIKSSSRENEIVLDFFGGSGSTLIACEQLNRICYINELEPKWCDVIIQRWENFTGEKAAKVN